ncbi:MAG TPA: class I SAM-dependent methyltransferase [Casimicrobiaceae bacterium]|nr:class I SAM-dependent methyltransferase [Casimicrobiaceae bacterium]
MHVIDKPAAGVAAPDFDAIKTRQQATWAAGDFGVIGTRLQIVGETLCEAADVCAGERVLDVAAGNGNASLAAARRFAEVTSTDYVPALLDQARQRAQGDRLTLAFQVADVENLPFPDASFDVVLSTFGAMFAPNQHRTARELLRVTRPAGRIAMANWTPEGFLGDMFRVLSGFVPPPAGLASPMAWGSEPRIVEFFGPHVDAMRCQRRNFNFRFASAEHFIEIFRTYYGPTLKAFAALAPTEQEKLHAALADLLNRSNTARNGTLVVPAEYLEVVITRR